MTTSKRRSSPPRAKGLLEALELSFQDSLRTPEGTSEPVALLWTDTDRQWADLIPRLRAVLPHVFTLGTFNAAERTGPAIWLRCVVDGVLPDVKLPLGAVPILYLPGVSRQSLRSGEDCPRELQPLVELQYRGRVWHQRNGRDWTVEAFLVSEDGLGLDVSQDVKTREASVRALALLAEAPIEGLRGHRLDADDFDRLAVSDPIRDLLRWVSVGDELRTSTHDNQWRSFCSVCRSEFQLDPDKSSPSDAASRIVAGGGKWDVVWQRFREAPKLYPGVSKLLREISTPLLQRNGERDARGNLDAELALRKAFQALSEIPHADAVARLRGLETDHGRRRQWVWAQLGGSPLAVALEPLARLAAAASTPLGGATIDAVVTAYAAGGWQCDRAALESLGAVETPADTSLIQSVVRAVYAPWLDASARHFQGLITASEGTARSMVVGAPIEKDVCVLFADGLRFDIAGMLQERLEAKGLRARLTPHLAPLPTVTATGKPFATVVSDALEGGADAVDFNPQFQATHQAVTAQRLRDEMAKRGLDILGDEARPPKNGTSGAWVEAGRLDELGHKIGAQLALHLDTELEMLVEQITALLDAGWLRIRVVTDHGWLLLPGGLPRVDLPTHLAATKWARCATVKGDSKTSVPVYSWHWNLHVRIASPPGIACFAANEYAHGGVSPQECIIPELIVERGEASTSASIASITWRGMRCRISVNTNDPAVVVDLRLNWKKEDDSIATPKKGKMVGPTGETSLVVDDKHEGAAATVVVADGAGNVLDRKPTTVGEAS